MAAATREILLTYGNVAVSAVAAGTGVYSFASTEAADWIKAGAQVRVYGAANAANNGIFTVVSVGATSVTTGNSSSIAEGAGAKIGFPVGGASASLLDGLSTSDEDPESYLVRFRFLVQDDDEAKFSAKCKSAESAFRTQNLDFQAALGSSDLMPQLKHSDNTGFNADPRVEKVEDIGSTGRSRMYTVVIRFGLPADVTKSEGRRHRKTFVDVAYSPSRRRRLTIRGEYTAVPGSSNTARQQYEAKIAAYASSAQSALGGNWELAEEPTTEHDDTNKVLRFSRTYDELIFSQAGATDDAAIVRQNLLISRKRVAPGDTPVADRLQTLVATYSASIDKTVTQDLTGKWSSIRTWIVDQARTVFGGGAMALVEESPQYNFDDNRITATMVLLGSAGSGVIENRVTTEDYIETGLTLVPAWTGDPSSKYDYDGPSQHVQTVTVSRKTVNGGGGGPSSSGGGGGGRGGAGFQFSFGIGGPMTGAQISAFAQAAIGAANEPVSGAPPGSPGSQANDQGEADLPGGLRKRLLTERHSETPLRMGLDGYIMDVVESQNVKVFEIYTSVGGGGGSGRDDVATQDAVSHD